MSFLSAEIVQLFESLDVNQNLATLEMDTDCSDFSHWSTNVCNILSEQAKVMSPGNTYQYYKSCCQRVAPHFKWILNFFVKSNLLTIMQECLLHCEWMHTNLELFADVIKHLHYSISSNPDRCDEASLALYLLSASQLVEISLRRLLRASSCSRTCPSMLKDILAHPALNEAIGSDLVRLLSLLVGPPVSLNLRNLAWHGFLLSLPKYVMSSLCALCATLTLIGRHLCHSNRLLFDALCQSEYFGFIEPNTKPLNCLLNGLHISCLDRAAWLDILLLLKNSLRNLVSNTQHSNLASCQLVPIVNFLEKLYTEERYYDACCFTLVSIEAVLRVLYCNANNLPDRELCALNSAHFTTLDVMLCSRSCLVSVLPEGLLVWLLDVIQLERGPRFRDHLSHGEFSRESIGPSWAIALTICLHSILMFSTSAVPIDAFVRLEDRRLIERFIDFFTSDRHSSVCHPAVYLAELIDITWRTLTELAQTVNEINKLSIEHFPEDAHELPKCSANTIVVQCKLSSIWELTNQPCFVNWLSYLNGLVVAAKESLESMNRFGLIRLADLRSDRQLRSRQRANLASFVAMATNHAIPFCNRLLQLTSYRLTYIVDCLNNTTIDKSRQVERLPLLSPANNKMLKRLRKRLDNWRANSAPDKNRWLECAKLMSAGEAEEDFNELWSLEC
ncbi:hypothetical protein BOX15_Mlig024935g4 [Macrostomum lignano]|uniref:DUF4209 domain-containing protein n=1 Tax=Macrostomum lignano TaxID=282301 RepID=A0A267E202_9PLAT|nr:hypothetical protein BOX15_Mlig024935g4 [Macrostomum lignano]